MIGFSRHRNVSNESSPGLPEVDVKGIRLIVSRILDGLDLVVYALVGLAFVAAAVLAFIFSISHLLYHFALVLPLNGAAQDVLDFVSDLLLVLIIMELLSTIRSYVEKGDTSVEPFLIIGIISATRGILSIGARLYLTGAGAALTADEFRNAMIELAVNALVIIVLGVTIRILDGVMHLRKPESRPDVHHAGGHRVDSSNHSTTAHQPEPVN